MQIVFQDPLAALDPRMTVGEIIGEPFATFLPSPPKTEHRAQVREMMARVGVRPVTTCAGRGP
jgi:oligopeptide transport system ATP-binding protein